MISYLKLIFKANILLGIYFAIKKRFITIDVNIKTIPSKISDIYSISNYRDRILAYFESNRLEKEKLLKISDCLLNNEVIIYNKKINLSDYSIQRVNHNLKQKEIFNRDLRFHWEIYRCKYLYNNSLTYFITHEEPYAKAVINCIINWKEYSPIINRKVRYNGMEAAIKLIYLSLVDPLLDASPYYNNEIRKELIYSVIFHAEYIYKNYDITLYGLESNHALSCSVGLIHSSPRSVYESMACGTPVIVTELPWYHGKFEKDLDLLTVPIKDSSELANNILQILNGNNTLDLDSAYQKVNKNINMVNHSKKLESLYYKIL
jgi:hypothetical protein